jgi:predicted amidohydrolase
MKVSLVQMNSQPNVTTNLNQAEALLRRAIERDQPDLLVLPEHFDWAGGSTQQKIAAADSIPGGKAYGMLQSIAKQHHVWIHAGSILERVANQTRIFNTSVVFDNQGEEVGRYRKIHLFDITAPDGKAYLESASVAPGSDLFVYEAHGLRIGCAICYDLRFSRLFDGLAAREVDLIVLPAAFTLQTGKDHWEVLCRARAIEFQAYFIGCGQWGSYPAANGEVRTYYGNSMICDPWGQVVARASDGIGIVSAHIDVQRLRDIRNLIPMAAHRREFPQCRGCRAATTSSSALTAAE